MAQTKKTAAVKKSAARTSIWSISWKRLLIWSSVALNVAFLALFILLTCTHALDSMYMRAGLSMYCDSSNDFRFNDNSDQVKALRNYICERGSAAPYFRDGLNSYLDAIHISH